MKINGIDVEQTLESVQKSLQEDQGVPQSFRVVVEMLLLLVKALINQVTLGSRNSSIPPSQDPNRRKKSRQDADSNEEDGAKRRPGGQKGRIGTTLRPVAEPDEVVEQRLDPGTLPSGHTYREDGFEARQVADLHITCVICSGHYSEYFIQYKTWSKSNRAFTFALRCEITHGNFIRCRLL